MEYEYIKPPEPPLIETFYNTDLPKLRINRFRIINQVILVATAVYFLFVIAVAPSTSLSTTLLVTLFTSFGLTLFAYFHFTQNQDFTRENNLLVAFSAIMILGSAIQISGGIQSPFLFFYILIVIFSGLTLVARTNLIILSLIALLIVVHAFLPSIDILYITPSNRIFFLLSTWGQLIIISIYALLIVNELVRKDDQILQVNTKLESKIKDLKKFNLLTKTYQSLSTMRGTLNYGTLKQLIPMTISKLLGSEVSLLFLAEGGELEYASSWSKKTESVIKSAPFKQCSVKHGADCIIEILKDVSTFKLVDSAEFLEGCSKDCATELNSTKSKYYALVPLKVTDQSLGVIVMGFPEKREFEWEEKEVLRLFAYTCVLAIENARYYSKTRENFEKYNAILTELIDAVVVVDKNNKITFFNEQAEKLIGIEASDTVGKDVTDVLFSLEETGTKTPREKTAIFNALKSRKVINIPKRFYKKPHGDLIAVSVSAKSYRDENGNPIGVMLLISNLSEQIEFERTRNEFISVASHELQSPITDQKEFILRIREDKQGKLSERQKNFLELAYKGNQRFGRLVEDLLRVSQIDKGKVRTANKTFDISEVTKTAVEDFIYQTRRKRLDLSYKTPKKPIKVRADATQVREILAIMLGNALKYTKTNGEIIISHHVGKGKVTTYVKDSGPPIPKEVIPNLFKKFYRDPKFAAKIEGTGLGLYIVKQLVNLMGGQVSVKSNKKIGVVFSIVLPKA